MQEFSSISVSSYEAGSLAERLTEQSRDGWHVVAIVPTGSTVTAYLARETDASASAPEPVVTTSDADADVEPEPAPSEEPVEPFIAAGAATAFAPEPVAEPAPEPVAEVVPEPAPEIVSDAGDDTTAVDTVTEVAPEAAAATATTDTAAAAGAAPAGWYADPSGRFELRYWDGGQWTEHVSRAGQQYTDPPVA